MATTMGSPPTTDSTIVAKLESEWKWLTTHLLLLALVAGLVFAGVYGVESLVARHDAATATKYDALAKAQAVSNQQVQQSTQQQISQLAQQNAALQTQVQALLQQNNQRNTTLVVQQKTDATLPPTALAQRWDSLLGTQNQISTTPSGFGVTPAAAVDTVTQLESVPVLTANNKNLQAAVDNQTTQIANDKTSLADEAKALDSEKTSHVADNKAGAADLASCKASARKSKTKWFFVGVVIGFVGRVLSHG
jgi:hypothetical protein